MQERCGIGVSDGVARRGEAWGGVARRGEARRGEARRGEARPGAGTRRVEAWRGVARRGTARLVRLARAVIEEVIKEEAGEDGRPGSGGGLAGAGRTATEAARRE